MNSDSESLLLHVDQLRSGWNVFEHCKIQGKKNMKNDANTRQNKICDV